MSRPLAAVALLAALFAAPSALAQRKVEPGEWEQVMTITASQMPSGPMHQTIRQCITSREAEIFADRDRWAKEMMTVNPQAKCKLQESKQDGDALAVVLACEGDVQLRVRHEFHGTTGTIDAETLVGGVTQNKNHIESRKVADTCSPAAIEQWKRQNPGKTFAP
jgi:hypothetical protein